MNRSFIIKNVKIPRPHGLVEGSIAISNGRIIKVGKKASMPRLGQIVNARGLVALPGLIDVHVHLRDMELAYKEDFLTGTMAAARGGFTTVLDMPNTLPPTITSDRLREKAERARDKAFVDLGFHGGFTTNLDEVRLLCEEGVYSLKLYMNKPLGEVDLDDKVGLKRAFEACAALGLIVTVHAEDGRVITSKQKELASLGRSSVEDFLQVHSEEVEVMAVREVGEIGKATGARIHICHISTPRAVEEVEALRREGVSITCEATPHHLLLTDEIYSQLGGLALTVPPLRHKGVNDSLWKLLSEGAIDVVASDHAPHALEEKRKASVWEVSPGVPGLETTLPLMLTQFNMGRITLKRIVELLASKPAEAFGLKRKGDIAEGKDADIVLVDLKAEHRIDAVGFYSKARYSPFNGWACRGRPLKTFLRGELIAEEGEVLGKPLGKVLRRGDEL